MELDKMHPERLATKLLRSLIAVVLLLTLPKYYTFGQDSSNDDFEIFYDYIRDGDRLHQTGVIYGILQIDSSGIIKNAHYWSSFVQSDPNFIKHKAKIESYSFSKRFANLTVEYLFINKVNFGDDQDVNYKTSFFIIEDYLNDFSFSKYQRKDFYISTKEKVKFLPIIVHSTI